VTVPQGPRRHAAAAPALKPAAAPEPAASGASQPSRDAERAQASQQQRARDSDARAILQSELQREQARLQQLLAEYNDGRPERQGDERNYQRYLDRVAALKASIERSSADIAALQRELARFSRP
jgi:chromosome segregation ATPase